MSNQCNVFWDRLRALVNVSLEVDDLTAGEIIGSLEMMKLKVFENIEERSGDE